MLLNNKYVREVLHHSLELCAAYSKAISRAMFNLTITIATRAKAVQNRRQRRILCFDAAFIGGYSVSWSD